MGSETSEAALTSLVPLAPPCLNSLFFAPQFSMGLDPLIVHMREFSVTSTVSYCLRPCGLLPTMLLCPWNSPGKNAGVGCHFLLQGIFLTQRTNLSLLCPLHWYSGSLPLVPSGKPTHRLSLSLTWYTIISDYVVISVMSVSPAGFQVATGEKPCLQWLTTMSPGQTKIQTQ